MIDPFVCPHCEKGTKTLVFHENGRQSCHKCAPEVRKMEGAHVIAPKYQKTHRGYLVAR